MTQACVRCGSALTATDLVCPSCRALVHAERLRALDADANAALEAARPRDAIAALEEMRTLLPADTVQARMIAERLAAVGSAPPDAPAGRPTWWIALGGVGALLLKFKSALFFLLTKAKALLLVGGQWKTAASFLLSFGVYWTAWGWRFALGFLVAMYLHELGHVAALRHYGIPASAPMFVPGLGAFVRMNAHPPTAVVDARIGLAGPVAGVIATLVALLLFVLSGERLFAAVAVSSAFLNLFNLTPAFSLDGARAFRPMTRVQSIACVLALFAAVRAVEEPILYLGVVAGGVAIVRKTGDEEGDGRGTAAFLAVVLVLVAMHAAAAGALPAPAA